MENKTKAGKMTEPIDLCNGELSSGNVCPNKTFCDLHKQYQNLVKTRIQMYQNVSYVSAFYCSSKNWHKFKQADKKSFSRFAVLSNGMIIKSLGKSPSNEMEIYKVVVPKNYTNSLLSNGVDFFEPDPHNQSYVVKVLPNVSMKIKETYGS